MSEIRLRLLSFPLCSCRIASANFPSGHFTHIFIDECGQAQETEGVVALAGILDNHLVNPSGGHLILAGDPRQLGPVLRSPAAKDYGLGEFYSFILAEFYGISC